MFCLPEVYIDKKEVWYVIQDRGKGVQEEHPTLIPICTLAPTVPCTIVPEVGWNYSLDQVEPVDVDGAESGSSSCVD